MTECSDDLVIIIALCKENGGWAMAGQNLMCYFQIK